MMTFENESFPSKSHTLHFSSHHTLASFHLRRCVTFRIVFYHSFVARRAQLHRIGLRWRDSTGELSKSGRTRRREIIHIENRLAAAARVSSMSSENIFIGFVRIKKNIYIRVVTCSRAEAVPAAGRRKGMKRIYAQC